MDHLSLKVLITDPGPKDQREIRLLTGTISPNSIKNSLKFQSYDFFCTRANAYKLTRFFSGSQNDMVMDIIRIGYYRLDHLIGFRINENGSQKVGSNLFFRVLFG